MKQKDLSEQVPVRKKEQRMWIRRLECLCTGAPCCRCCVGRCFSVDA